MIIRLTALLFISALLTLPAAGQFNAVFNQENAAVRKKPVSFSHQPFLLLKVTPTALLGRDNVLQYGVELAPPFGKFSFGFDYGTGKGSWSLDKEQKAVHPEQTTKIIRGEIRGYFSDWYPFYALDKKPFGRYYALEYVQKTLTYDYTPDILLYGGGSVPSLNPLPSNGLERAIHVKFGNHFIVSRWFFVDGFVGIGVGQFDYSTDETELEKINEGFSFSSKPERTASAKGIFLSKTAGVRLCLPL